MRLLDRYILRNFLVPFIYCFMGFLIIWLIFDLNDNGSDFLEGKVPLAQIALFYLTQLPAILIITIPVAVLLALLYALSRMSRTNELVSMLTAGISIPRLLMPLLGFGLLMVAVCMVLNYQWVPHAEAAREQLLKKMTREREKDMYLLGHLFRNRFDNRIWYARRIPKTFRELQDMQVIQQNRDGNIEYKIYANRAYLDSGTRAWVFENGKQVNFNPDGSVKGEEYFQSKQIAGWSETPWRITSSVLIPEQLSVPELEHYLQQNADFPAPQLAAFRTHLQHRWARPWESFLVVLLAAPLAIVFSRRGVLTGVATAILIFLASLFFNELFLALGQGYRIPPSFAAWTPKLIFLLIGASLLYMKTTNRQVPWLKI